MTREELINLSKQKEEFKINYKEFQKVYPIINELDLTGLSN